MFSSKKPSFNQSIKLAEMLFVITRLRSLKYETFIFSVSAGN